MKIFLIILTVFVLVILAVLFVKLRIETEIAVENFKFRLKLKIKVFRFFGIKFESGGKAKKKTEKKKMTFSDIKDIAKRVKIAVPIVAKSVKKSLKIDYFETDIKLSLADPMNTGLSFAAVSSAANIFYKSIKMKKQFLDITPDFEKNEGFILKNICKMSIRPVSILTLLVKLYRAGVFNKKGEL